MARLMFSAGMFSALAAAMAPRRRGLPSGSPPPCLAAMVISLIRRVKILPRLASRAPFLCLIVAHFEWPDMNYLGADFRFCGVRNLVSLARLSVVALVLRFPPPPRQKCAKSSKEIV